MALMSALADHSIDAIVTDLPFGTTNCAWDVCLDLGSLWIECRRLLRQHGIVVLFASQPFTTQLIASNLKEYRHIWYWQKEKGTNFFRTGRQPLRIIEEVVIFSGTAQYTYKPEKVPLDRPYRHTMPLKHSAITGEGDISANQTPAQRIYKEYTHRSPTNLLRFARDKANKSLIPTQKPLALAEYFVKTYTNEGDLVLDICMGSGTIPLACQNLNRNCIGMEINPKHFAIAKARLDAESPPPSPGERTSVMPVERPSGGVIFTTLQKFAPEPGETDFPLLTDRRRDDT